MLEIVYQDEVCVSINKPAGMLVLLAFLSLGFNVPQKELRYS
jgi:23S rRNA-/tRNA-specific pseudouridylate synthase